jgi:hypothetical protein
MITAECSTQQILVYALNIGYVLDDDIFIRYYSIVIN